MKISLSEGLLRTNRQVEVGDGGGMTRQRIEATLTCAKTATTVKMSTRRKYTNQEGENNDNKTRRRRGRTQRATPPGFKPDIDLAGNYFLIYDTCEGV